MDVVRNFKVLLCLLILGETWKMKITLPNKLFHHWIIWFFGNLVACFWVFFILCNSKLVIFRENWQLKVTWPDLHIPLHGVVQNFETHFSVQGLNFQPSKLEKKLTGNRQTYHSIEPLFGWHPLENNLNKHVSDYF